MADIKAELSLYCSCHSLKSKGSLQRCHFVSFVMDIYGAKFQEHCFNISRDIVYSVLTTFQLQYYDIITYLICIKENVNISNTKKDTVQPMVATTSHKRPPLLSDQFSKIPKVLRPNHHIGNLM